MKSVIFISQMKRCMANIRITWVLLVSIFERSEGMVLLSKAR